jgi:hypothetical protein
VQQPHLKEAGRRIQQPLTHQRRPGFDCCSAVLPNSGHDPFWRNVLCGDPFQHAVSIVQEQPPANRNAPTLWNAFTTLRGAEDCVDSAETWTARCTLASDTSLVVIGRQQAAAYYFCRIESEIVDVSALSLNTLAASHHAVIMRYRCPYLIRIWQVQHFAARILTLSDVEPSLWRGRMFLFAGD